MDIVAPKILTAEEAHQKFVRQFAELRQVFLEKRKRPSATQAQDLLALFHVAFPIKDEYLNYVFSESKSLAENFEIDLPRLPDAAIFDLRFEPIAGMGHDFFSRLIYLGHLARDIKNHIDETIKIPTSNVPLLKLVRAGDIYLALREERIETIAKDLSSKTKKTPWFQSLFQAATGISVDTGPVIEISKSSTVRDGTKTYAHVNLGGKFVKLELQLPEKDVIQAGDLIAAGNIQMTDKKNKIALANKVELVIPKDMMAFLKYAEPDFLSNLEVDKNIEYESLPLDSDPNAEPKRNVEVLTNEHMGTIILGRIVDVQNFGLTVIIKDTDGNEVPVSLEKNITYFNLKKGDAFLALPSRLEDDGVYKIDEPRNVLKLDAPYSYRVFSKLKSKPTKEDYFNKGQDFVPTESMPP